MPVPAFIARRLPKDAYARRIGKGLTKACEEARTRTVELDELRAVAFSDHHRGKGDGADDFRRCEEAYSAALGWYLVQGHELWLLGDVEELWENRGEHVIERYASILRLEREFGARLWRFYGNHDMAWQHERNVRADLAGHLPEDTEVREALNVVVTDGGRPLARLFLVHGHQGTIDSGNLLVVPFSRFVVRFGWGTLQRARGFANTSPANDAVLRGKHDRAMAAWADAHPERIVLVAGHTHRPVFAGQLPPDRKAEAREREAEYQSARQSGEGVAAARSARELALVRAAREAPHDPLDLQRPSYYNTGCCSFGDGDVTGLEFADGKVRLVRWLDNDGTPAAHVLASADLREVLGELSGGAPSQ